jgi:penicillin amidase
VEILKDRWGVSHIYAGSEHDLFFAQGYNVARDRLFQLEIWRRQATGTMAEILGPRMVARDTGARLLRFRGDMGEEMAHYHPRGREIISAFVQGINAYIEEVGRNPEELPPEFRYLDLEPGLWTPEVVVSRHNGLFRNLTREVSYGRALEILGPDELRGLGNFEPEEPVLHLPEGISPSEIPEEVFSLYRAHRSTVRFLPQDIRPEHRGDLELESLQDRLPSSPESSDIEGIGSNNWVVSGALTASGRPMMANDPHRSVQVPSLRYFTHLVGPGWNVIGGGEPALPGISIGHNEYGAWGLTIFATDQEDLYVYETHPDDPNRYRYRDGWLDMEVERETIEVEGERPRVVELKYTRHGPVLFEDPGNHRAYGVRAAWLEVGTAPYLPSLRIDQARSWEEFRQACAFHRTPSENMVWADVEGNIGWQAVGIAPIRDGWDGLLPVPGDGSYEWQGFVPGLELPWVSNPPEGFFATANQNNVPRGYPYRVGFAWSDPFRHHRLEEVLASGRRFTMTDMMELQQDELSLPARALVPLLRHIHISEPLAREARDSLLSWDYVMAKESVAAGIYRAWEREVMDAVYRLFLPYEMQSSFPARSLTRVLEWLDAPDGRFSPHPLLARNSTLANAFVLAVRQLEERFGGELPTWTYGREDYKHVLIRHPLSRAVSESVRSQLDVGPLPRGGYGYTVNSTGGGDNQGSGATFRVIADVGAWDHVVATNSPGQSGVPGSDGYNDLFDLWAEGRYFPLLYTRSRVESVTAERVRLLPGG